MANKKHTTGREGFEDSEGQYYDGILGPNQADKMIAQAEDGQVVPPPRRIITDAELEADFLDLLNRDDTGTLGGRK